MLLDEVHAKLDASGVPHALIGAMAMAAHGVSRASLDVDLLATDARLLEASFWSDFPHGTVDPRPGGTFDPLAGVVRIHAPGELPVDIVLFGPHGWQHEVIGRAEGADLACVALSDLVLLKLFAGSPRDRADVHALLDLGGADLEASVESAIGVLPNRSQGLWRQICSERR